MILLETNEFFHLSSGTRGEIANVVVMHSAILGWSSKYEVGNLNMRDVQRVVSTMFHKPLHMIVFG